MNKVLVVDDTPDVRETLKGKLTDAGYEVELAANEAEALSAAWEARCQFALVDVRLHGNDEKDESGLILALALQRDNPKIRIIAMTGFKSSPPQIVEALRYRGVVNFIEKTGENYDRIADIIAAAKTGANPDTYLSLALEYGQPLSIRARGAFICSTRSSKVLRLNAERYIRTANIAWKDRPNFRFHVRSTGQDLWREIFSENEEIQRVLNKSGGKEQLVSFSFEAPKEFLRLPLEFIRRDQPSEYLVLDHPFTRFIYDAVPAREAISPTLLAKKDKLRVLIIASNTEDSRLPRINGVDLEAEYLKALLDRETAFIQVQTKLIPTAQATYGRIKNELEKSNYDIIHYAGHGSYHWESPEESCLYFWAEENRNGNVVEMKATELKKILQSSQTRFVYMSCCEGAATGSHTDLLDDDFLGLTDAIAQAGVPSVLGYRWPVSDKGAREMASRFYGYLLETGSPEIALWRARSDMANIDRNDPTWLSPILVHQV